MPNWSRFEQVFVSTFTYTNPLQEATLTAAFTSPQGETRSVEGFWDGGRIWRIRFCPETPGQWTFTTTCSDLKNDGLGGQSGIFLCTAPIGDSSFQRHGPIRVARDHRHFEHADGTPFFWLGDTVWDGARRATPRNWQRYADIRSSQTFNVALWSLVPGDDYEYESALTGFPNRIGINPSFFQRLDAKLETLSRDGILSAILPLADLAGGQNPGGLPPDQAILLYRYILARWGSEPVVWIVKTAQQFSPGETQTFRTIGTAVFTNVVHAPVILLDSEDHSKINHAYDFPWVDAYGITVGGRASNPNSSSSISIQEPIRHEHHRPTVIFGPTENSVDASSHARLSADQLRRIFYSNLLTLNAAGVTYVGQGIAEWDNEVVANSAEDVGRDLPVWEKALFMPGAKQMRPLSDLMRQFEFWRLRSKPDAIAGSSASGDQVHALAAVTEAKDLMLVYLTRGNPVQINLQAMPPSPIVNWLDPRNGSTRSAAGVVFGLCCEFPPPAQGDWILVLKSGK